MIVRFGAGLFRKLVEGHVTSEEYVASLRRYVGEKQPEKPRRRCGPWVNGACEKCGRLDPLDFQEFTEG